MTLVVMNGDEEGGGMKSGFDPMLQIAKMTQMMIPSQHSVRDSNQMMMMMTMMMTMTMTMMMTMMMMRADMENIPRV